MIRRVRDAVMAWNDIAETPDDAPLWAEVVGLVFAPALFVRAGVHVWVALLAGVDPQLATGSDVSLQSPIQGLRGDRNDLLARLGTVGVGVFAIAAWSPPFVFATMPTPVAVWVLAQISAVAADPLAYVIHHVR